MSERIGSISPLERVHRANEPTGRRKRRRGRREEQAQGEDAAQAAAAREEANPRTAPADEPSKGGNLDIRA